MKGKVEMAFENINSRCVWRYSLNFGEYGGLVFASSKENATEKILKNMAKNIKSFIWTFGNGRMMIILTKIISMYLNFIRSRERKCKHD